MKKKYIIAILIVLFVAILSVNFASAWGDTFECEGFYIEIPEGLTKANGFTPITPPNHIPLVSKDRERWDYNDIELSEVPLEELNNNLNIFDNHTESDLTIVKGQIIDNNYPYFAGDNITYAEFDKEGKHFYLVIEHYDTCTLDKINLNNDMKLIKEIKESIKLK